MGHSKQNNNDNNSHVKHERLDVDEFYLWNVCRDDDDDDGHVKYYYVRDDVCGVQNNKRTITVDIIKRSKKPPRQKAILVD